MEHVNIKAELPLWCRRWLLIALSLTLLGCQTPVSAPLPITVSVAASSIPIGLTVSASELPGMLTFPADRAQPQFEVTSAQALFADMEAGELEAILVHIIPAQYDDYYISPVALDGVVVIVDRDNQLQSLSLGQVQALFNGRIGNWSQVGGADMPVVVVSRERGSGVRTLFQQRVLGSQRVSINAWIRPTPLSVLETVATTPGAVGYVTLGSLSSTVAERASVHQLALDDVSATPATVGNQSYPLTTPLYWVSPTEPVGELRGVLAWLQSDEAQAQLGVRFGRIR
jgi:hypothetical protein